MKLQNLLLPLLLVCTTGCAILPVKETCIAGYMMVGDTCVPIVRDGGDGGPVDMGPADASDLGVDEGMPDAGPCGMPCEGATPVCDETSGTCVQCNGTDATACTGTTSLCDTMSGSATINTCVACNVNSDCTSLTAPECSAAHTCVACTADAACTGRGTTTACGAGTCVQCTAANEAACGASSCNPATHVCTTTARTSVRTCGACVADSECMAADNRCVPMNFMGAPRTGGYCLKRFSTGCAEPYTVSTAARASLSGATADTYCGINETSTTCDAVLNLFDNRACAPGTDADCGAVDLADGLCRTVTGVMNRCSYACITTAQCPATYSCTAGYCGS